jgi:hypothetical protein
MQGYVSEEKFRAFMEELDEKWVMPGWEVVLRDLAHKYGINPQQIEEIITYVTGMAALTTNSKVMQA